jgi:muramoyltetrapeptide carboxypeptidase
MQNPKPLQKGDTVALVCTARKNNNFDLTPTILWLENWGLKVVLGKTTTLNFNQLAGTDLERAADFQSHLDNPAVKAIWCIRGGYGTVRMIDLVDFTNFCNNPKWVIGFSDITVLHSRLANLGIASIHATMPIVFHNATFEAKKALQEALFGKKLSYQIKSNTYNKKGSATGELVGGNLSVLYSLLGSKDQLNLADKILFIEDLDEYLYHIDRMLVGLERAGFFKNLAGLVVGGMTDMRDNAIPWGFDASQIICNVLEKYHFPIAFEFPAGHIDDNRTLIFGNTVTLKVDDYQTVLNFI